MSLYVALLYYPPDRYWLDPAEEHTAPGYAEFFESATAAGVLRAGEALQPPDQATIITVAGGKGGQVTAQHGASVQTAEILGGTYLIEAPNLAEATQWAALIPAAWRGKVELRPVVPMQNKLE
jgi:hypothetical protein